ncbi:MAG: hypothetical protein COY42_30480 [Armatimonadetes bacterium CG_4_10_14_0_8_um_filter_66_14]|nr:MAG: hypothetical protein AUJ96_15770 [Armatimonadetes bacterium CG2_30_66_41]PIU94652.1 MAG: hypothetical protein COS65_06495 [Armatimonadetes bacterium CG06_land_8_20_14_3_00_66_21]PIZ33108.1 MAG: hypothetical protein COY42_30480 [Armatimonadetes bacterium CG_4_10_14_0_8_um_filter_66_14]PJB64986.1 MAG: hypothetical protein CO096_19110 [Armatimonadetes bacterium CG_4_9_14_3_um_filter_66_14]
MGPVAPPTSTASAHVRPHGPASPAVADRSVHRRQVEDDAQPEEVVGADAALRGEEAVQLLVERVVGADQELGAVGLVEVADVRPLDEEIEVVALEQPGK